MKNDYSSLVGKKVNNWTIKGLIKKQTNEGYNREFYQCICSCGLEREVLAKDILNGKSTSCGCKGKYKVGDKIGELTIIKNSGAIDNQGNFLFECLCSCGNKCLKRAYQFEHSKTNNYNISCGCLNMSNSEKEIMSLLTKWNIDYIYNYTDERFNLKDNKNHFLYIDFFLPKLDLYIEYDGEQHFKENSFNENKLDRRKELDEIKNNILKDKLFRIRYDENIEQILYNIIKNNTKQRKFFISSDEHGDYEAIIKAEQENGYDESNPLHYRVSAGDCWDRGQEGVKVYEHYKRLCDEGKMTVCVGNHHKMFIDFLKKENYNLCFFNHKHNGINTTIDDFTHQTCAWIMFIEYRHSDEEQKKMTGEDFYNEWVKFVNKSADEINEEYPDLLSWLESMPDYLELKNSIITHGMIDGKAEDWRKPRMGWENCHWAKPEDAAFLYNNTGKHIYLGHIDSDTIREILHLPKDNYSLYTRESGDVTYLDGCTILTNKVNMVIVEDEEIE